MFEGLVARYRTWTRRARRLERREWREFRRWLEHTDNLIHLTVLVFVPLLIAGVTALSNAVGALSFLLFPPLAAGAYTLFADPEGRYASPWRFVAGLTAGAVAGWLALVTSATLWYAVPPDQVTVNPASAGLAVLLTVLVTWFGDVEEPAAYSTALLVLVTGASEFAYVVSVAVSSTLVAGVFVLWRDRFYEQRERLLYRSVQGDDHVLVPMVGRGRATAATFAARLAAATDAGKVVLHGFVEDIDLAAAERDLRAGEGLATLPAETRESLDVEPDGAALADDVDARAIEALAGQRVAGTLEDEAARLRSSVDVPVEVVVTAESGALAATVLGTAAETNCDLIVVPFEGDGTGLPRFVRALFGGDRDVIALQHPGDRTSWDRVLVPVRKAGDTAHAMIEFAERLAGRDGRVSVCHCIPEESERRRAESMLANLVETATLPMETRVSRRPVEDFIAENQHVYDLVFVGASTERSAASRLLSRPTVERLTELSCDVAVVHRANG